MSEITIHYYTINEDTARRAREVSSFYEYKPGSATNEYRKAVDEAYDIAEKQKSEVPELYHDKIDDLVERFARRLADNTNSMNSNRASYPSWMIAGPSNYNLRKHEKQTNREDKLMQERNDIFGILDKIKRVGTGGISSDEENAVEMIKQKIADLEAMQKTMKAVNAYVKKNGTIEGYEDDHLPEKSRRKIEDNIKKESGYKPFGSYSLSNNNANIKRLKQRVEELETRDQIKGWKFDGGEVVANLDNNRLQIFFDEKPDGDKRDRLKQSGFKWAPSQNAWQRMLNKNAVRSAKYIEFLAPIE